MANLQAKVADILSSRPNYDQWFAEAPMIGDWARRLYSEYAGITDEEELKAHLMEIRDEGWKVYKYRCVASFFFVNYNLGETYGWEWYTDVLERVKGGATILDLGCAFGHIARNLVYDGAPQENIISGDLRAEFWQLGYRLFRDKDKFHGRFFQGDIFDEHYLEELEGKIDIIHTSAFFHLFTLPRQKILMSRLLRLVSTKPGAIIFGRQAGCTIPCQLQNSLRPGEGLYMHSEESFKEVWETVAGQGDWDIQLHLKPHMCCVGENGGERGRLHFIITRL